MGGGDAGIVLTSQGGVATVTLSREAKRNALAHRHFTLLADLLHTADADANVSVIVLTGAGDRAFCAGADLSPEEAFFARIGDAPTTGLGDVMRQASRLSKPLVGRINGHCYAGGVGLLSMCDTAIAVDDARFALPEITLGLFPFVVAAGLKRKVPPEVVEELARSGRPITAARAVEIGMIAEAVPRAELDRAIDRRLKTPPEALLAGRVVGGAFAVDLAAAEAATRSMAAREARIKNS
jgi:enoyl-CoA hydratase/carnithine racemase